MLPCTDLHMRRNAQNSTSKMPLMDFKNSEPEAHISACSVEPVCCLLTRDVSLPSLLEMSHWPEPLGISRFMRIGEAQFGGLLRRDPEAWLSLKLVLAWKQLCCGKSRPLGVPEAALTTITGCGHEKNSEREREPRDTNQKSRTKKVRILNSSANKVARLWV